MKRTLPTTHTHTSLGIIIHLIFKSSRIFLLICVAFCVHVCGRLRRPNWECAYWQFGSFADLARYFNSNSFSTCAQLNIDWTLPTAIKSNNRVSMASRTAIYTYSRGAVCSIDCACKRAAKRWTYPLHFSQITVINISAISWIEQIVREHTEYIGATVKGLCARFILVWWFVQLKVNQAHFMHTHTCTQAPHTRVCWRLSSWFVCKTCRAFTWSYAWTLFGSLQILRWLWGVTIRRV